MKTLIYGAGPIGRWLALKLKKADKDVTLLARGASFETLEHLGVRFIDAPTGEHLSARVRLVKELDQEDRYDLVAVPMVKSSRLAVSPILGENRHLRNILFLGNDVAGPAGYLEYLSREQVLLGFPGAGGGWDGDDLVISDRDRPGGKGKIYIGELDGKTRERTLQIKQLFEESGIRVSLEKDIDGWLKYHFAFMSPTAGVIFKYGGQMKAVATSREAIHHYCQACREAGDVLRKVGYVRRQPPVFNLYYWLPRWLEPKVFGKLFGSDEARVRFGLHAEKVGPELLQLAREFENLKARAQMETPNLDRLLASVKQPTTIDPKGVT
jgi:2-dehydropantoate 2-reductase